MKKIYAIIPALVATLYSCGDQSPREIRAADKLISRAVDSFNKGDIEHYVAFANKAHAYAQKASDSSQYAENAQKREYVSELMPKALDDAESAMSLVWKSCAYGFKDVGRAFINAESITNYLYIEPPADLNEEQKKGWYAKRDELENTFAESVMLFYERYKNFIATQELQTRIVDETYAGAVIRCSIPSNLVKGKEFEVVMSHDNGRWQIEDFATNYYSGDINGSDAGYERNVEILFDYVSSRNVPIEKMIEMLKGKPITDVLADIVSELENMPREQFDNNPLQGNFITLMGITQPDLASSGIPIGEQLYVVQQKAENGDMYITVKSKKNDGELITLPLSQIQVEIEPTQISDSK